jgi:methylmalonyl-CoA decarboxylase
MTNPAASPVEAIQMDRVAVIRMQDPSRRNALSDSMLDALIVAFDSLAPDTRAVVLRAGPADKVWCAGFDIGALAPGRDPLAQDGKLHDLFRHVRDCPCPVIGMLHGSAWGGGTDLALRCDILIGDPTASLAFTPARLGLPYDGEGLLNALLRAGPALAMEMFATADPIPAERALRAGMLNHLVPETELEPFTLAMAHRIAANAPLSVSSAKEHLRALAGALPLPSAQAQRLHEGRRAALDSADYGEGLAAFAEKRPGRFAGS